MIAWNRDFVAVRKFKMDWPQKGQNTVLYHSVVNDKKPERDGYVRATIKCFALVIESDGAGGTNYKQFAKMDIGGMIPYFVVNKMSSKMPLVFRENLTKGGRMVMEEEKGK